MNPISEKIEKFLNEGSMDVSKYFKPDYDVHTFKDISVSHDAETPSKNNQKYHNIRLAPQHGAAHNHTINTADLKKLHKAIGDHLSKLDDKATEQREKQAYSQSA